MSWVGNLLQEISLYWEPPIRDGLGGYLWGEPIEIPTRWENRHIEIKDETGANIEVNTIVWTTSDVIIGGYLLKGEWEEISYKRTPPIKEDNFGQVVIVPGELSKRNWAKKIIHITYMNSLINKNIVYNELLLR